MTTGGLLLRAHGELLFLPANEASRLAPLPPITRVPGAPAPVLGVAIQEDELVTVIAIGEARESLIVCSHRGDRLGLVGGEVVATGMFETDADGVVLHGAERARAIDLDGLCAGLRSEGWLSRTRGGDE